MFTGSSSEEVAGNIRESDCVAKLRVSRTCTRNPQRYFSTIDKSLVPYPHCSAFEATPPLNLCLRSTVDTALEIWHESKLVLSRAFCQTSNGHLRFCALKSATLPGSYDRIRCGPSNQELCNAIDSRNRRYALNVYFWFCYVGR